MEFVIGVGTGVLLMIVIVVTIKWSKSINDEIDRLNEDSINKSARINQLENELIKYKNIIDNK